MFTFVDIDKVLYPEATDPSDDGLAVFRQRYNESTHDI
jgi:hypothetical protein